MNRRHFLGLAAISTLWPPLSTKSLALERTNRKQELNDFMLLDDTSYFLSKQNPLATRDQQWAEQLALKILDQPEISAAKAQARSRVKTIVGQDGTDEGWSTFDEFLDEWVFSYILKAVNSDPNYPRIIEIFTLAHSWFGHAVPGSRGGGGPGPDQAYLLIPIDFGGHYELIGKPSDPTTAYCVYTLMGNAALTMTQGDLEGGNLKRESDGSYRITIDPEPANGRPNHLQSSPGTRYLFIRDCRNDWRELPDRRRIRRISPPSMRPWTEDEITSFAGKMIIDDLMQMFWWVRLFGAMKVNAMSPPFGSSAVGGLSSQMISFGKVSLEDNQAFIISLSPADAAFGDIVLHDYWFNTIGDYAKQTSSLTHAQSAESDGRMTYVISAKDPGVYNWLNPNGLKHLLVAHRWQGLLPTGKPDITSEMVNFDHLSTYLPPGVRKVTPDERERQLSQRLADFNQRFTWD